MMDVEYNGILASSLGIYAKNIPDIPAAVRKEKTVDIPGMDGTLILLEGGYESTEIKVRADGNISMTMQLLRCHHSMANSCSVLKIKKKEIQE